jgi:hypothetical protein
MALQGPVSATAADLYNGATIDKRSRYSRGARDSSAPINAEDP